MTIDGVKIEIDTKRFNESFTRFRESLLAFLQQFPTLELNKTMAMFRAVQLPKIQLPAVALSFRTTQIHVPRKLLPPHIVSFGPYQITRARQDNSQGDRILEILDTELPTPLTPWQRHVIRNAFSQRGLHK